MENCLFCKIANGEIPSHTLYEDEHTLAFLDINPVHPGHALVIPKIHSANIFDIDAPSWTRVCETVRRIAQPIEKATGASGINVMMNNRDTAGQVIDHTHVHVIPRHRGDGLRLWPQKPYARGAAENIAEKIRENMEKA
jgi:histidine triad (HIT) family protein